MNEMAKCPVSGVERKPMTVLARVNRDWWPKQLNVKMLHQNSPLSDPMGKAFNYAEGVKNLDLDA